MDKNALVVGFGISGKASFELLRSQAFFVIAADRRYRAMKDDPLIQNWIQEGLVLQSDEEEVLFSSISLVVLSPGIDPSHSLVQSAKRAGVKVIGEIELALSHLQNQKLIAVTGTNGKTTTVLFAAHLLRSSGVKALALGNVGSALSKYALKPDTNEVLVIELSSFQLESLTVAPWFDVAAILNITPNHLNRHASMEEYASAKLRLAGCVKPGGAFYVSQQVKKEYDPCNAKVFDEDFSCFFQEGVRQGLPEPMNIQAAVSLCSPFGVSKSMVADSLKTFRKPPHRIEWVAEIDGVAYYNDSKATNIEAVAHAVRLLDGPILLIAGGVDKGASYAPWIEIFQGKVKRIAVFGEAAWKIDRELSPFFPVDRVKTLKEALDAVKKEAKPKDTVLLSPGCSSLDQFAHFEERGDRFKKMVLEE